jgi:2-polyprenyl-6-methoxyphenol hydroxylase-like FAD-dependent oxidoreductase
MENTYDAIVVGARCAGSATGMLLARRGHRVLVVDRATFPSDTLSTHLVHPPGVAALQRWGLLDRLASSGCPPIGTYTFDFGPFALTGTPRPADGVAKAFAPRRTVLDKLLVDAAVESGAEVREGFKVDELLHADDGTGSVAGIRGVAADGTAVTAHARVVIGADGRYSSVAKAVDPPTYEERPSYEAVYFAYWSGAPTDAFEVYLRPERAIACMPTHDDLTLVLVAWPSSEFEANRGDVEGNYLKSIELAPAVAERLTGATRQTRLRGTGDLPGYFRKPYGPGWALVGDAGYLKDPCTAQGISDGLRDAESLADALDRVFRGAPFEETMADHHRRRDDARLPMYGLTCQLATLEPPPPEIAQRLASFAGDQDAMDTFVSVIAGTEPVSAVFA